MKDIVKYKRGDIYLFNPGKLKRVPGVQHGARPVLILSNDKFNLSSGVVNCVPLTTSKKHSPAHVELNLFVQSYALCEQIMTVSKLELGKLIGLAPAGKMAEIEDAVKAQLGLN